MVCETRNLLTLQYTVYAEPDKGWTVLRLIGVCVCVWGGKGGGGGGGGGGGFIELTFVKFLTWLRIERLV